MARGYTHPMKSAQHLKCVGPRVSFFFFADTRGELQIAGPSFKFVVFHNEFPLMDGDHAFNGNWTFLTCPSLPFVNSQKNYTVGPPPCGASPC